MSSPTPLVSVCCITYNHEEFIREALDGFLIQQTSFPIEIVIHDDASNDNTPSILREYQEKYPHLIKMILQTENQYSKRGFGFISDLFAQSQGKYIALCEGDDYWTDPLKLQRQIDFLEANSNFAICFHNAEVFNKDYPEKSQLNNDDSTQEITTLNDLLQNGNYITTASAVIKKKSIENLPDWFTSLPFGDYPLYLIAARYGNIKYINEIMSVYRIHQGGIHGKLTNSYEGLTKAYQQHYKFWQIINKSGMIDSSRTISALLKAIENVIDNSLKSGQVNIYLRYNYLLLVHSRSKSWEAVMKNIINICLLFLRRGRNILVEKK